LLESDPIVNPNTFEWLVQQQSLPFNVVQLFANASDPAALRTSLEACQYALYVPQPAPASGGARLAIVNSDLAAEHMSASLFALFARSPAKFSAGDGSTVWVLRRGTT
jgi:hypothetical protein